MRKLLSLFKRRGPQAECQECQECKRLEKELADMANKFHCAASAQRAQHRRLMTLKHDMPQVHDAYFTRLGEALRMAEQ